MNNCVCGCTAESHFGHTYQVAEREPSHCSCCQRCKEYKEGITTKEIIDSFIKEYPISPFFATIGDGGFQIVVYVHQKNHNYKFPKEYLGVPVKVSYVGRVKPC